uniref:Uncharacterized protein n=1 Tax=Anguilla anguilla TaxID=7936 RepID=A0A0E9XHA5_ANGAN
MSPFKKFLNLNSIITSTYHQRKKASFTWLFARLQLKFCQ